MYVPTNTSYSCSNVGKTGMLKVNVGFLQSSICGPSPKAIATTMDISWKILVVSLLSQTCQFACRLYNKEPSCEYFFYNSLEQNCEFLSSSTRTCDIIRGPPTPSLEECSEGPSKYYITS